MIRLLPEGESGKYQEQWRVTRNTDGDAAMRLTVNPCAVDASTPIGTRADLRRDDGGLIGSGKRLLRVPWHPSRRRYRLVLTWDLSEAPPGTRAVWSGGHETSAAAGVEGSPEIFSSAICKIGAVQSFPPPDAGTIAAASCTLYWFGDLPNSLGSCQAF